jgi:CPA2 family monovalent cation:H+ antiporter-2
MEAHENLPYLREALIFFTCAGIVIPLLQSKRISPVLGFLVLGNVIGPYGLGLLALDIPWLRHVVIADIEGVSQLAEVGVTLLLFVIGLELSFERLLAMRRLVFGAGSLQVALSTLIIGIIAYLFGNAFQAAFVLGYCLALSSTAVVVQTLMERRELATPVGRASFAILLLQDLAVVPLLVLLTVLGTPGADVVHLAGMALVKALVSVTVIVFAGRVLLRALFNRVSALRQPGSFMALTLLVAIGMAAITASAGLSTALGAFLAGLLLAETQYRHEVEVSIEPFKALLIGLFFLSVGMGIDLRVLMDDPLWILASVGGLFLCKAAVIAPLLRAYGLSFPSALEAAMLLGGGGEFAFIAIGGAMASGVLDHPVGQFMLIVVGLSMLATPPAGALGRAFRRRMHTHAAAPAPDQAIDLPELEGHVIILGFGRVGQLLARALDANSMPYLAIDSDAKTVELLGKSRLPLFFGDASRAELLERAGAARAAAIVATMNDAAAALRAVNAARAHFQHVPVLARAHDEAHARLLRAAGATGVVPETLEASLQLAGHVLEALGMPSDSRDEFLERQRERELARPEKSPIAPAGG